MRLARIAAAAVAAAGLVAVAAPAAAATRATSENSARYCGPSKVTVVVDFTHWKAHDIWTGCASRPSTGLAALRKAGFSYTFVARQPGLVCTIDHRPKPCNGAPASDYWSYWHAKRGGKWTYSKTGAGSYHPKNGQVEGWSFGHGHAPHVSVP